MTAPPEGPSEPHPDDWTVLSVPIDAPPPGPIVTEEDRASATAMQPAWVGAIPHDTPIERPPPPPGPPGGRYFSLDGRPAPALYLIAWLLAVGGLATLFVTTQAAPSTFRTIAGLASIVAIGLGLSAGAGYQVVARAEREPMYYRGPSPLLAFGVVLVISALTSALLSGTGLVDSEQPAGFLLGLLLVAISYAVVVWLFAVRSGALTWGAMGWPTTPGGRLPAGLGAIGMAVLVMAPATFVALVLGGIVATVLGVEAPSVLPTPATSGEALAVALAAAVVAPIGEELFFRGFALTAWARDMPARAALIRSAGFFAVVHIANIQASTFREGAGQAILQLAVIFPVGLVLGWLFLRRGIIASIAGHVTYNSLLLLLLLLSTRATATG